MSTEVPPHGTRARYQGSRTREPCHCQECKDANSEYGRQDRGFEQRVEASECPLASEGEPEMETIGDGSKGAHCPIASRTKYRAGCRFEPCTAENRDYQQAYMRDWRAR